MQGDNEVVEGLSEVTHGPGRELFIDQRTRPLLQPRSWHQVSQVHNLSLLGGFYTKS